MAKEEQEMDLMNCSRAIHTGSEVVNIKQK